MFVIYKNGGIGNRRENQDYTDHSIVKISLNTQQSPAVTSNERPLVKTSMKKCKQ